jgi:hypothetical protein
MKVSQLSVLSTSLFGFFHHIFWHSFPGTLLPLRFAFVFISLNYSTMKVIVLWKRVILLKLFGTLEPLVHNHEIYKIACSRHREVSTNILYALSHLLQDILVAGFRTQRHASQFLIYFNVIF